MRVRSAAVVIDGFEKINNIEKIIMEIINLVDLDLFFNLFTMMVTPCFRDIILSNIQSIIV